MLLGGSGQVGTALQQLLPNALIPSHQEVDLLDINRLRHSLVTAAPTAIINCAAYTAVDAAEADEVTATRINGAAVGVMASYAAEADVPLVTYSTDYVFPGIADKPYLESDSTGPINAYGRSKLAGEQLALATHPGTLIIRTSWVISATHANFVRTILRLAGERDELTVVDDQVGCPTVAADLAAATVQALAAGASGVLHLTNQGATTWFDLAIAAVELAGLDAARIRPCATADFPTPAARPAYSVLGSERRANLEVDALPHWRDSLPAVVAGQTSRPTGI